jgi:hypothetical protein
MMRVPNSTPMVCGQSAMTAKTEDHQHQMSQIADVHSHFFSVNWWSRQDLPTPMSPMMMYLKM